MTDPQTPRIQYQRLAGRARRSVRLFTTPETHRLWLGPDHLLLARTTYFEEQYQRLYFKDLQSLTVAYRPMNVGVPIACAVAAAALVGICFGLALGALRPLAEVAAVIFLCVMAFWIWYGPSCRCHAQTAVQTLELVSLRRWRNARKVIPALAALIEGAQGRLGEAEIAGAAVTPPGARPTVASAGVPQTRPLRSTAHWVLFASLIAGAVSGALFLWRPSVGMVVLELVLLPVTALSAVLSLVWQQGTDLDHRVRGLAWAGALCVALDLLTGWILGIWLGINHPETSMNINNRIIAYVAQAPRPGQFFFYFDAIMAAVTAFIGLAGLALLFLTRRAANGSAGPAGPPASPG